MSKKIQPMGTKLIVFPIDKQNEISESGLELVNLVLQYGEIIEVGLEVMDVYKKGDIIIYPAERGNTQHYQKKNMLWLDGKPFTSGGDVWAIVTDENIPEDKGDSL